MTESRNRDLATSIGAAVAADNIATDGSLAISGVTTYTNLSDLPSSGVNAGDLGFVTANNGLYIRGTSGWYVIALVNTSPTYTTSPNSSYDLATDGSTTTVITIVATDPEGFAITYSATADSGFNGLATVSQGTGNNTNVFTVTPKSEANATTTSGTLTFRATDGVNNTDVVSTFTLVFDNSIQNSEDTYLLIKGSGNNKQNTIVDGSSTAHTINTTNTPLGCSLTPFHPYGYSRYFNGDGSYLKIDNDNSFTPTNKNFTIEAWIMPMTDSQQTNATIFSRGSSTTNREFALYMTESTLVFKIWNSSNTEKSVSYSGTDQDGDLFYTGKWYHVAGELSGSVSDRTMNLYINGRRVATTTGIDASYVRDTNSSGYIGGGVWAASNTRFIGYITDLRLSYNSSSSGQAPRYSGAEDFVLPTTRFTNDSTTQLLTLQDGWPKDNSGNNLVIYPDTNNTSTTTPVAYHRILSPYNIPEEYNLTTHGTAWHTSGTRGYVHTADVSTQRIGTNSFCIEGWVYVTRHATGYNVLASRWNGGNSSAQGSNFRGYTLGYKSSGPFGYLGYNGSSTITFSGTTEAVYLGQWTHIAYSLERTGTTAATFRTFVSGKKANEISFNYAEVTDSNAPLRIGAYSTDDTYATNGLMSDFRLTVGDAVYTADFTPPTAPFTNNSNTKLRVNADLGIYDASGAQGVPSQEQYFFEASPNEGSLILQGNAKSSTTQTKNASSSMYFDGTDDLISLNNKEHMPSGDLDLGEKDWGLSMWVRPDNTSSGERVIIHQGDKGTNGWGLVQSGTSLVYYTGGGSADITISSVFSAGTWVHIALDKTNNPYYGNNGLTGTYGTSASTDAIVTIWVNGNSNTYNTTSGYASGTNTRLEIGGSTNPTGGWGSVTGFVGYLEDIKFVQKHNRNRARLQAPFIISRNTSTSDSNTFLLCAHASAYDTVHGDWTVTNGGTAPTVSRFSPVKDGYSLKFDGTASTRMLLSHTGSSSDYNIGDADNNAAGNWSMDGWFWTSYSHVDQYFFSNYGSADADYTFMLGTRSSGVFQLRRHTAGAGNQLNAASWRRNRWQHFLFTQEYKSAQNNVYDTLYIDGVWVHSATNSSSYAYDFQNISIGGRTDTVSSSRWYGYLSNIRIQTGTVIHPGAARDSNGRYSSFSVPTAEIKG